MRTYLVTGASSGIGRALVDQLLRDGHRVFGLSRTSVAADTESAPCARFQHLATDLTSRKQLLLGAAQLRAAGAQLDGLINAAGISIEGPIAVQDPDDLRRQFEVNVLGPMNVVQAFLPCFAPDSGRPRRIVNVSSVAARIVLPFMGSYAASKRALEAMSDALRRELQPRGIGVVIVQPGPTASAIWRKSDRRAERLFAGTDYEGSFASFLEKFLREEDKAMPAAHVAKVIVAALTGRRYRTRILVMRNGFRRIILPSWLPASMVDRKLAQEFGLVDPGKRARLSVSSRSDRKV